MKVIKLMITDQTFKGLQSAITVKKMCDNFYSVTDHALNKILQSIEDGKEELTLKFKDEE